MAAVRLGGVAKGAQKLAAAGVVVQKHVRFTEVFANDRPILPGEIPFLVKPALDMGKIPSANMGLGLFGGPEGFQLRGIQGFDFFQRAAWETDGLLFLKSIPEIRFLVETVFSGFRREKRCGAIAPAVCENAR